MIRTIGFVLVAAGFLVGAGAASWQKEGVGWEVLVPAVIVGAIGVAVLRFASVKEAKSEGKLASNIEGIEGSLSRIVENMKKLNATKESFSAYDIRHEVDKAFVDDIDTFVQARKSIVYVYGLQAYGMIMSHFAAGERYLNRVWSASADGYVNEVNDYLGKAQEQFQEAQQKLQ
ncbi:MAG: hypothetical protein ACYTAF_12760, partial [Planctomycetota bacterium]